MHFIGIKEYEFFYLDFLIFHTKTFIVTSWLKRIKEKHKNMELISCLNILNKFPRLKNFTAVF